MTDNKEFVSKFVEAAKANDEETMKTLAQSVSESSVQDRVDLLEELNAELKKTEANEEVRAGLEATLSMLRLAQDAAESEDSAGEEAKADEVKAEEVTQDVAADTSADEAKVDAPEAKSDGEAPAKEEKAEKSEDK